MYRNHRVVCVTPAGRRRYMQALIPYIVNDSIIDQYDIWVNTDDPQDIKFLKQCERCFDKINLIYLPDNVKVDGNKTIAHFFQTTIDLNTIYVRMDDDIVFIEDGFMEDFLNFRIDNPQYFITYPLIINNAISTSLLMMFKKLNSTHFVQPQYDDLIGWKDPNFAQAIHQFFLNIVETGQIESLKIPNREMSLGRFSINCISWFGHEFAKFGGKFESYSEEAWLSVIQPTRLGKLNGVYGGKVVSHFAFFTQRDHLDSTNLLERYLTIANNKHPDTTSKIYKIISSI